MRDKYKIEEGEFLRQEFIKINIYEGFVTLHATKCGRECLKF